MKFKRLEADIDNLKSQMGTLKDKITKTSESTNAGFKRKKIRSMKREVDKINKRLRESEKKLELVEPRVPKDPISRASLKLHPPKRSKCIEAKIAEINKKIKRAKNRRNKECLIAKRESLQAELTWGPRQLEGAFGGAYRRYGSWTKTPRQKSLDINLPNKNLPDKNPQDKNPLDKKPPE